MFKEEEYNEQRMIDLSNKTFYMIQSDPELWKLWNTAKTYKERNLLTMYVAYNLGFKKGFLSIRKKKRVDFILK